MKPTLFALFSLLMVSGNCLAELKPITPGIRFLEFHVEPSGALLALIENGRIIQSLDGGKNWKISTLDKLDHSSIFLGSHAEILLIPREEKEANIYKSTNKGISWRKMGQVNRLDLINKMNEEFGANTDFPGMSFVCEDDHLMTTSDGGKNWIRSPPLPMTTNEKEVCKTVAATKKNIFVVGRMGLYKSDFVNQQWEKIHQNQSNSPISKENLEHFLFLKSNSKDKLFLLSQGKVFVSVDDGEIWREENFGFSGQSFFNLYMSCNGSMFVTVSNFLGKAGATAEPVVYRVHDGKIMNRINPLPLVYPNAILDRIKVDQRGHYYQLTEKGPYRSDDFGQTWYVLKHNIKDD